MIFKLLSVSDKKKTEHNIAIVENIGITVTDVRIAPLVDSNGNNIEDLYVIICDGTKEQLERLCSDYNVKYRQEYEGAPLYL